MPATTFLILRSLPEAGVSKDAKQLMFAKAQ